MRTFVEKYAGDTRGKQQFAATVVLKKLESFEFKLGQSVSLPTKWLEPIFKLNPKFLTPEQNFNLGLFLFNFGFNAHQYSDLLSSLKESRSRLDKARQYFSKKEEIDAATKTELSNRTFTFLQIAAEQGNSDARRFLAALATSKLLAQELKPSLYLNYIKEDDLFKKKTFDEFLTAVKHYQPPERQEVKESKSMPHPSAFFRPAEERSFDDAFEDLRREFCSILEMKDVAASINQCVDKEKIKNSLATIQERFAPLDKILNYEIANELQLAMLELPPEIQVHFDPLINKLAFFSRRSVAPQ